MRINTLAAVAAFISTSLAMTAPAAANSPDPDVIGFNAHIRDNSAVIVTDGGSMAVEDGTFTIRADDGTVLTGTELAFRVDDFEFPIDASITGRTATLTPALDMTRAVYKPVAMPFEDKADWDSPYDREQDAWNRMTSTIGLGLSIGALGGALGGAAVGCVLGGLAGAGIASATLIGLFGPFLPAAVIGCMAGVIALGVLGSVAGTILISTPIAIAAAVQYFTTINEPMRVS
ncbi:hypothetical protein ACFXHA_25270 [Nocardia sp. NPDC059240]|uniref:hypothetical protein n=1 Tax=Nocardia sp. NPDC059240 TaxID=3346786 RepID=UPI0036A49B3F